MSVRQASYDTRRIVFGGERSPASVIDDKKEPSLFIDGAPPLTPMTNHTRFI